MTAQELFDTVVAHLRSQGRKAEDRYGCMYRGPEGTSCAAGCLITDEEYSYSMERSNIRGLLVKDATPSSLKDRLLPHVELLVDLQDVHDDYDMHLWEERLAIVARRNELQFTSKEK